MKHLTDEVIELGVEGPLEVPGPGSVLDLSHHYLELGTIQL